MHKKVEIIIAGAQKCGTTTFFELLKRHPAIYGPDIKETHFFDNEVQVDWEKPDYDLYHSFFKDDQKIWLESTPIYIFWPPSMARIARYNPSMKLIFLFRDPIDRAWSNWCMNYANGWDTVSFKDAIRAGRKRVDHLPPLAFERKLFAYVERGLYGQQVSQVLNHFSRQQVLFLDYAELSGSRSDMVVARAFEFLGLDSIDLGLSSRWNVKADIEYPSTLDAGDISYLRELFVDDLREFSRLTGIAIEKWPMMNAGSGMSRDWRSDI